MGLDLSGNGSRETVCDEEIETWLSDSRVGNNSVLEHRSRRPVLSPLRNCVDRCHVEIPSDTYSKSAGRAISSWWTDSACVMAGLTRGSSSAVSTL